MDKAFRFTLILTAFLCLSIIIPVRVDAREGDCGYEGGISSGEAPGKTTYEYQEVCFLSGEPIVLKGTLLVKKSAKKDAVTVTYTYNLKNLDKAATLTRVLIYNTTVTQKPNGQKIEATTLTKPTEAIKINSNTYTLTSYDFTRTNIIDSKPAINYYAGNIWGRKIYQTGSGTAGTSTNQTAAGGTVTVDMTGNFYGYDQYWGSTEVQTSNYVIQSEKKSGQNTDKWGGTASVSWSSSTTKQLRYVENQPDQISFSGGYVQTQYNNSIMEYSARLPQFDEKNVSTDKMVDSKNSLSLETFPVQTRLLVPDLKQLKGHWAENDIDMLFSLEVFKQAEAAFDPEQYMTRAEFAAAVVEAAKEVPADPSLKKTTTAASSAAKSNLVSPFSDVAVDDTYFNQIDAAYKRGLISGIGAKNFNPDQILTRTDAITILINALGLQTLAPNPAPVTTFKDNDRIPGYARRSFYVADKISLIQGDDKGYIRPYEKVTNANAATLLNSFINYMRDGIRKDYRERIVNFST